jgi:lipopolysaccharide transport system ATP-binding protein
VSKGFAIRAQDLGKRYVRVARKSRSALKHDDSGAAWRLPSLLPRDERNAFWALRNATFDIARGESVGIIGLNGAGKSTLLKLLSQITTPTTGVARIFGRLGALLEVGTGFHHELSGRENVFLYGAILGMTRKEVANKFAAIVDFAEIGQFIDVPVKRYSSGMTVRLAFAVAAHLDPDILLLDEVLAVGDFAFQRKCMTFTRSLQESGATILFVSHNMFSIKTMCERVIYLRSGQIVFDGPTDEGLHRYENDGSLRASRPGSSRKHGPPPISMEIDISNESGAPATVFDFGERMRIRTRFVTSRKIVHPDLRVTVVRSDELHCTTFSASMDGMDIPSIEGESSITLLTPPVRLVSDRYSIKAVLCERSSDEVAASNAVSVHVRHPLFMSEAFGVWHESAEWRLTASGDAV